MTFRAQAIADLPVFLNTDEFGDSVLIDGDTVACVLVPDEAPGPSGSEGVSLLEATLYLRASDQYSLPVLRQRLVINDQTWTIVRVDQEQGMLVIRLQWFDS